MEINRNIEENSEKELGVETVLVLQGGGSLGAYECGVYKTLAAQHTICSLFCKLIVCPL
jgi:predicted acylesterase/phospholipase RssA